MTIAKNTANDEIIHGNDLRGMDNFYIKNTNFECPYEKCRIKAIPCSFKEENLNQSYFRYPEQHKSGCRIHDQKYKNNHDSNDEKKHNSPPAPVISLLRLDTPRTTPKNNSPKIISNESKKESNENEHPISSSSIKPVVDYYINNDNHDELLSIPPYETRSYKNTFQLILYKERIQYIKPAIYFGSVQSNIIVDPESDKFCFTFLARKPKTKQAFKLEIDVSGWNNSQKEVFYTELEKQRSKAEEYRKKLKNNQKAEKFLTVFFFGFPDKDDQFLFKTDYFKLVYIAFLGKFKTSYNDTNYIINNKPYPALIEDSNLIVVSKEQEELNNKMTDQQVVNSSLTNSVSSEPEPVDLGDVPKAINNEYFFSNGIRKLISFFKK